jgi:hypothetical protein
MAGRKCADIVFLIDASGSMAPCLEAVKNNIGQLSDFFALDRQNVWDIRLEFLAHSSWNGLYRLATHALSGVELVAAVYKPQSARADAFFTKDVVRFQTALAGVTPQGDETTLVALDTALDLPWRPAQSCHRAVICLTDEAIETGERVSFQMGQIDNLINKIHSKRIKLTIIAPQSDAFDMLSMADRCEYEPVGGESDGLRKTNFSRLMAAIGKSVSVSQNSAFGETASMPLYGQDLWVAGSGEFGVDGSR